MKAMVLEQPGNPLVLCELEDPTPTGHQVLIKVKACGICRTDLHIIDGELDRPDLPLVLGHEIIGTVSKLGSNVQNLSIGQRVGVPWLGATCGICSFCKTSRENLCDNARFTGYQHHGGYAEYSIADSRFCFPVPETYSDANAAPLFCAGLIGYRALRMAGDGKRLGLYGFGAAAHIIIQVARHQGKEIFVFTRPGNEKSQNFASRMGALWTGGSDTLPPVPLDGALLFAPVGALVPQALKALAKGGIVVCAGIHMSDIPAFPYNLLWGERTIRSVANLTRKDAEEFLEIANKIPIQTKVNTFPLAEANEAIARFKKGEIQGAAVLTMG